MRSDQIYTDIMQRLQNDLSPTLTYHNVAHTESVVAASEQLGRMEGLTDEALQLLRTAALLHDSGFLKTYKNHEAASCDIAREELHKYGYTEADADHICRLIMATRIPQTPEDKLAKVLCDADLHYLGTNRYTEISENLYQEFLCQGVVGNRKEWKEMEKGFLTSHRYFTASASKMYGAQKEALLQNIATHSGENNT